MLSFAPSKTTSLLFPAHSNPVLFRKWVKILLFQGREAPPSLAAAEDRGNPISPMCSLQKATLAGKEGAKKTGRVEEEKRKEARGPRKQTTQPL